MKPHVIELYEKFLESDKVYILYHRSDVDGCCSAAIVLLWIQLMLILKYGLQYENKGPAVRLHGVQYGEAPPLLELDDRTMVFLVDFHYELDLLHKWAEAVSGYLVWIDHHQTALDVLDGDRCPWFGVLSTEHASCYLTWDYLMSKSSIDIKGWSEFYYGEFPPAVILASRYDSWDTPGPFWPTDDEAYIFQCALKKESFGPIDPRDQNARIPALSPLWSSLLSSSPATFSALRKDGARIAVSQQEKWDRLMRHSFTVEWEGLRWLAINAGALSSQAFSNEFDPKFHDAMLFFSFITNGEPVGTWLFNLRAFDKEKNPVRPYAEKYGGGGHPGAAGFRCDHIPFELPIRKEE